MKKTFKWGIASFLFGAIGMGFGYYGTFANGAVSASSDILSSTDSATKLMMTVFTIGAIFILVSIILFLLSAMATEKK